MCMINDFKTFRILAILRGHSHNSWNIVVSTDKPFFFFFGQSTATLCFLEKSLKVFVKTFY